MRQNHNEYISASRLLVSFHSLCYSPNLSTHLILLLLTLMATVTLCSPPESKLSYFCL